MTDDTTLRTRIAKVLREFLLDHFIVDREQAQGLWPEYLADAVIRELDLKLGCHGEIEGFLSERGQR